MTALLHRPPCGAGDNAQHKAGRHGSPPVSIEQHPRRRQPTHSHNGAELKKRHEREIIQGDHEMGCVKVEKPVEGEKQPGHRG